MRCLDQLDDAVFLAMDLEYLGAADLAWRYLDWYAEFAGDPVPPALHHHFLAYRAFVRAKVAFFRHCQGDPAAADTAVHHTDLALSHLRAGIVSLILVGGLPGTGKSTLSGGLADRARRRRDLHGPATEGTGRSITGRVRLRRLQAGIYSPQWTQRVYTEVLHRADELLRRGECVIVDASWTAQHHRSQARAVADHTRSRLAELCCSTSTDIAVDRIDDRIDMTSDADAAVRAAMQIAADPWPTATMIDTSGTVAASLEHAAQARRYLSHGVSWTTRFLGPIRPSVGA